MSLPLRYWVLLLSCAAIATLVGDVFLLNFVIIYSRASHVLPEQYKTNKSIELASDNGHTVSRQQRALNTEFDQGLRKYLDSRTTAHPIPLKGEFLNAQTTNPPPTLRTRRPTKPKGSATILTNPNVPIRTTTALQSPATTPLLDQASSKSPSESNNTDDVAGKALRSVEDLRVGSLAASNKSKLLDRDWAQFAIDSLIFTAPGLGMLAGYSPMNYLVHQKGSRVTIGVTLLFSFVFTMLQLKIVSFGAIYVCFLRFFQGLTCAPLLSFIGVNTANWATLREQLLFLACSFSSILFAPAFSWSIVCLVAHDDKPETIDLEIVHYIISGATILLAIFWLLFYRDYPIQHKWVDPEELNQIATGKVQNNRVVDYNVLPLLLKSASAWSMLIASFGYFSAFALIVNFLPVYLFKVLKIERNASILLTFVIAALSHIPCIFLNKFMCGFSYTVKIRVFNTVAFVLTAFMFIVLAALPPEADFVNTTSFLSLLILLPLGLSTMGFIYGSVIYGRFYTQHIVSSMQLPFAFAMILVPFFVVFMSVEHELRFWRFIFLVISALTVLSSIMFAFLVRGEPASWAEHTWDPSVSYKMRDLNCVSRNEECGLLELRQLDPQMESSRETNIDQY